jgi:hypothetical protein
MLEASLRGKGRDGGKRGRKVRMGRKEEEAINEKLILMKLLRIIRNSLKK